MEESIVCLKENDKKKSKSKINKTFPTIKRTDIMTGLLSTELTKKDKAKLSNLYAEITYMEKKDLKYITEITVSSQTDSEIYDILRHLNNKKIGSKHNYC